MESESHPIHNSSKQRRVRASHLDAKVETVGMDSGDAKVDMPSMASPPVQRERSNPRMTKNTCLNILFVIVVFLWLISSYHLWKALQQSNNARWTDANEPSLTTQEMVDIPPPVADRQEENVAKPVILKKKAKRGSYGLVVEKQVKALASGMGASRDPNTVLPPAISIIIPVLDPSFNTTTIYALISSLQSHATSAPALTADARYDIKEIVVVCGHHHPFVRLWKARGHGKGHVRGRNVAVTVVPMQSTASQPVVWPRAVNAGVEASSAEFIVLWSPLILFQHIDNLHWLRDMVIHLDNEPGCVAVQPVLLSPPVPSSSASRSSPLQRVWSKGVEWQWAGCPLAGGRLTSQPPCLQAYRRSSGALFSPTRSSSVASSPVSPLVLVEPSCVAIRRSLLAHYPLGRSAKMEGKRDVRDRMLLWFDWLLRVSHGKETVVLDTAVVHIAPHNEALPLIPLSATSLSSVHPASTSLHSRKKRVSLLQQRVALPLASAWFGVEWGKILVDGLQSRNPVSLRGDSIVWDSFCGCTGWGLETVNFVAALKDYLAVQMVADDKCLCRGLPLEDRQTAERARTNRFQDVTFFVSHKPPTSYPTFPYHGTVTIEKRPRFVIGRSMTETLDMPGAWVERMNTMVDEVWVPSLFHKRIFTKNGVKPEKLAVVPLPFDTELFDPDHTQPHQPLLDLIPSYSAHPHPFVFLSTFKFEPRKGWDILLRAYFTTFSAEEPVVLVLHTYLYKEWAGRKRNVAAVRGKLAGFARSLLKEKLHESLQIQVAEEEDRAETRESGGEEDAAKEKKAEREPRPESREEDEDAEDSGGESEAEEEESNGQERRLLEFIPPSHAARSSRSASKPLRLSRRHEVMPSLSSTRLSSSPPSTQPSSPIPLSTPPPLTLSKIDTMKDESVLSLFPPIVVLTAEVDTMEMPQVYKACDAFVLPTRGEGWCMPCMEAMSLAKPIIVTNFSGPTAFLTGFNSYPLRVEKLVPATDPDVGLGFTWAEPSLEHLRGLLRHVSTHPAEAHKKGLRARRDVVRQYSRAKVAERVAERLVALKEGAGVSPKKARRKERVERREVAS